MKMPELKELPTQEDIDRIESENSELKSQVEQLQHRLQVQKSQRKHERDMLIKISDDFENERNELKAQVEQLQEKTFDLGCFDVDLIRCLKTIAFEHNHADIQSYQKLAKKCMDRISAENRANEIKAQAVEEFKKKAQGIIGNKDVVTGSEVFDALDHYSNQLRQQNNK